MEERKKEKTGRQEEEGADRWQRLCLAERGKTGGGYSGSVCVQREETPCPHFPHAEVILKKSPPPQSQLLICRPLKGIR